MKSIGTIRGTKFQSEGLLSGQVLSWWCCTRYPPETMAPYHGVFGIEHPNGRQLILPRDLLTLSGVKARQAR